MSQRPRLPVQSPCPCPAGRALLPIWLLQLTSLSENLKLPAHGQKVSLGSLLSLPIAYKVLIIPKLPLLQDPKQRQRHRAAQRSSQKWH